jgi:hypothetical protein
VAVQALVRAWKDDPDTLQWLKALAQSDKDRWLQQEAVKALAQGWKDNPHVQSFLASLKK